MALTRRAKPIDVAEARRLYEQTNLPVDHIAKMHGVERTAFYRRVRKWGWRMRKPKLPLCDPPRGPDEIVPADAEAGDATFDVAATAARIRRAIGSELDAVEKAIAQLTPDACEQAERTARTLASLARTLQEVARLDLRGNNDSPSEDENDRGPDDSAGFVSELVRRLDEFARRGTAAVPDVAAARDAGAV